MIELSLCPATPLYTYYRPKGPFIALVVDILRASTSMLAAFDNGVKSIIPVASIDEAKAYAEQGYLTAAERNTERMDFADFGNDPEEFTREKVCGKDLVFTTSNGTYAIEVASDAEYVLIAAYSNLQAVANFVASKQIPAMVVAAGWQGTMSIEDCLFAGALKHELQTMGLDVRMQGDAMHLMDRLWQQYGSEPDSLYRFMQETEHYQRLKQHGLEDALSYCLQANRSVHIPILRRDLSPHRLLSADVVKVG